MPEPTYYLYDPGRVMRRLTELEQLRRHVGDPVVEGSPCRALLRVRRSPLQIFRLLAAEESSNIQRLLELADGVAAAGVLPRQLVRTRDHHPFSSAVAETLVAAALLTRGFSLTPPPIRPGLVPEFVATADGEPVAIEVYSPRGWDGLDQLPGDVRERIVALDLPLDFELTTTVRQLHRVNSTTGRLIYIDPSGLARALDDKRRVAVAIALAAEVEGDLRAGKDRAVASWSSEELNLDISVAVEVEGIASAGLPCRPTWTFPLGLSGYAPEAILAQLVRRRIRRKADRRQGRRSGLAPRSALIVDLGLTDLTAEIEDSFYHRGLLGSLQETFLDEPDFGYDLIALVTTSTADGVPLLRLHATVTNDGHELAHELFGPWVTSTEQWDDRTRGPRSLLLGSWAGASSS